MNTHEKGRRWRRAVQTHLDEAGLVTRYRPLGEAGDDITAEGHGVVLSVEAKDHRTMSLGAWVDQAVGQVRAAGSIPVVVAKRRGRADPGEGFAVMRLADLMALLRRLGG